MKHILKIALIDMLIVVLIVLVLLCGTMFIFALTGEIAEALIWFLSIKTGFVAVTLLGCIITGVVSEIKNISWTKKKAAENKLSFDEVAVYVVHFFDVPTFDDFGF